MMANQKDVPTIKATTKARGGVTGHNVRYVLAFGLAGAIIAFLIIGLYFYGVQFNRGRSPGFCFFGTSRTPDKFLRPANDMVRRFPPVRRAGWREAPCICRGFFFWLCR